MDIVGKLNDRFHNLGGTTIAEHKRYFNTFAKDLGACKPSEIHAFLKQLDARNNQEEIFRVRLLRMQNKYDLLLDVLFQDNKIVGKVITKNRKLMEYITLETFLSKICPNVSFANRMRFINRLVDVVNDTEYGERVYESVFERYGLRLAKPFLIVCTEKFVRSKMKDYNINFEDADLIKLHKKYPNILQFYFGDCKKNFTHCRILGHYLVHSQIETFHELLRYGEPQIGKRGFLKYLLTYKEEIINNKVFAGRHYRVVHKNVSYEEFLRYFKTLFAEKVKDFSAIYPARVLRVLPLKDRGTVFFRTYEEVYGKKFNQAITEVMEVISNEDRTKLNIDVDKQTVYLPINKAILLIKDKIVVTLNTIERSELLVSLLETCRINRDNEALLSVLRYFCSEHKNDTLKVREEFLSSLSSNSNLQLLNQGCWDCINELLKMFELSAGKPFHNVMHFLIPSAIRKVRLSQDCTEEVNQLVCFSPAWDSALKYPEIARKLVLLSLDAVSGCIVEGDKFERSSEWFSLLSRFNRAWPRYKISYYKYPEILHKLFDWIGTKYDRCYLFHMFGSILTSIPTDGNEKKLRLEFLKKYMDKYPGCSYENILMIIFKYNPELLEGKFRDILTTNEYLYISSKFAYELSKCHFNNLAHKFSEEALNVLNNDEKRNSINNALCILSYNWNYLEFIKKFQPENIKLDPKEENAKKKFTVRRLSLINLKHFPKINQTLLQTIVFYSQGDYLKYSLLSLYSVMYNIPENLQLIFFSQLLDQPSVAVRKHAIYLQPVLGIQGDTFTISKRLGVHEENLNVQKVLFKATFHNMCASAKPEMFELLSKQLTQFEPKDTETIQMLTTIDTLPKPIIRYYLPSIWMYLQTNTKDSSIFKLLNLITNDEIVKLSNEFCDEVATFSLFHPKGDHLQINNYIYMYLRANPNQFDHRIQIIFGKIKTSTFNFESSEEVGANVRYVHDLFNTLCRKAIEDVETLSFCTDLKNSLTKLSLPIGKFYIEMLLTTTENFIRSETEKVTNLAKFIVNYQLELLKQHTESVFPVFNDFVKNFINISNIKIDDCSDFVQLQFAKELLRVSLETRVRLLVIKILPRKSLTEEEKLMNLLKSIIKILRYQSEPIVEIYLAKYFSQFD